MQNLSLLSNLITDIVMPLDATLKQQKKTANKKRI